MLNVYDYTDYRKLVRDKLKDAQVTRKGLTLRKIAEQIPIQYTYLSRALNHPETHLNEDHLFRLGRMLGLRDTEMDYSLLLRAHALTADTDRRKTISDKIQHLRSQHVVAAETKKSVTSNYESEVAYRLNPLCVVIHVALTIKPIAKDPRQLCSRLNLNVRQLKSILRLMNDSGMIELDADGITVRAVHQSHFHFGRDHHLMRVHQSLVKSQIQSRLPMTDEEEKMSFLATFTMDQRGFALAKTEFEGFLKRLEKISSDAKDTEVYQMAFDLFKWF